MYNIIGGFMYNDIFYRDIPKLDLHGYDMQSAKVAVEDFILENVFLKKNKIIVIHGVGKGLVKKSVHDTLKNNKFVKCFKVDNYNCGMTIIDLDI